MICFMKTDDLIDLLAADTLPVPPHAAARRLASGLALAVPVSLSMMVWMLGVNPLLSSYLLLPIFWLKFGGPVLMALAGLGLVARLGRPGMATQRVWFLWGVPVLSMWAVAGWVLLRAPGGFDGQLVLGRTWRVCAENILVLSLPAFLAGIWVLRGLAPVRLGLAGAGAGALGGAVGAAVYALHCPELAAPFIAVWYVLGVLFSVLGGYLVGPRLLRW